MRSTRTLVLVEIALAIALAVVLNFIQIRLPFNIAGGSINLAMLPIAIVALRRGPLAGGVAGLVYGSIDFMLEPFILTPVQVLLDYPLPYTLFGAGVGMFTWLYRRVVRVSEQGGGGLGRSVALGSAVTVLAIIVGAILRLACHICSGVVFFAEYAADFFADNSNLLMPGPMDSGINVWIYSVAYNSPFVIGSTIAVTILTLLILPVLAKAVPIKSPPPVQQVINSQKP